MAMSGNLHDFSLADMFSILSQQRKQGCLRVWSDKKEAVLNFQKGNISTVSVSGRTPETVIRDVLVSQGRIKLRDYQELKKSSHKAGINFFSLLISKGCLIDNELSNWYQIAAEDLVVELFKWKTGKYKFDTAPQVPRDVLYTLSTDFLILEGLRQLDEWPRLRRALPNEDVTLEVIKPDFEDYELGQDIFIVRQIDGKRTLKEIRERLPFSRFRLFNGILNLKREKFIDCLEGWDDQNEMIFMPESTSLKVSTKSVNGLFPLLLGVVLLLLAFGIRFFIGIPPLQSSEIVNRVQNELNGNKKANAINNFSQATGKIPDMNVLVQKDYLSSFEAR
ncbi:MAG: DUF4388 domain-containing protein [Fibrobacteria bacterium]|nr:DUF4388 domain-containing protein [Fibrobacteria bacterium]